MAFDPNKERLAAERGFRGFDALIDPDTHVQNVAQQMPGQVVAKNEFGIPDKMTVGIQREKGPKLHLGAEENAAQDEQIRKQLHQRLLQKYSPEQIDAFMKGGDLPQAEE